MAQELEGTESRLLPLLPLRDIVVFPHMVVPLFVGRDRSVRALEESMKGDKEILLSAQKEATVDNPSLQDIFQIGTLSTVIQLLRLPDGTVKVLIEGKRRAKILKHISEDEFLQVEAEELIESEVPSVEIEAFIRSVKVNFETYVKLNRRIPTELLGSVQHIDDASRLAGTITAHLQIKLDEKQKLLETVSVRKRIEKLYELMQSEIEILQVEKRIRTRVKRRMEKTQREYYLNEQMQAIQKELGGRDEFKLELQEIEEKLREKKLSAEALDKMKKELRRLKMMAPLSPEATVVRNYMDWVMALPWAEKTPDVVDLKEAEKILDEDHHGLKKVKERILEHLAVHSLVEKMKSPILCFVGPPGVGKTSLGKSIARATGRNFVRVSLGGVRDEAEIRGHRRTYIGALPGKIIQYMKKSGSLNPVFLLDEIDKMSVDFRGDPSSALLEVLDPEQNSKFNDHYLELDYDLSHVMFITTANYLQAIPAPLMDRMEIISLPGYTEDEKLHIANQFLIPKQIKQHGLENYVIHFSERAIQTLIHSYTKEAGVRNLEREIASICRKIAKKATQRKTDPDIEAKSSETKSKRTFSVSETHLESYLGVPKYRVHMRETQDDIGLANGLAVTQSGGDLLPTEVTVMPGRGKFVLTGKLGDVMQESAQAALSYVRSRATSLGLDPHFYKRVDIHVHLPEGAIPKDGPSAGITIASAIVSALTHIPIRRDVAMTGEITLRGRVLPIGGLKEKILAAGRAEVMTIVIPEENRSELKEVSPKILKPFNLLFVSHMDEVLRIVLRLDPADEFFKGTSSLTDWRSLEPSSSDANTLHS